jgi:phosphonoacetaldehyde hydrolase
MNSQIRACIFDLGGTIVDRYSATPFFSLKRAFFKNNIKISDRVILKDMGMSKSEHIGKILCDNTVQKDWLKEYDKYPDPNDADMIYDDFNLEQNKESKDITILPETKSTFEYLKERDVKIGITTGFDKDNMDLILSRMEDQGLYVDGAISSTCLSRSRPYPDMMNKLKKDFEIENNYQIIKFDDSPVGIKEANNGDFWSVGVVKWSTLMEIVEPEDIMGVGLMSSDEYKKRLINARNILIESDADYVINDLTEMNDIFREVHRSILYDHF